MGWYQWLLILVSGIFQILVMSALLRGAYKRYPFVFIYSLVLLLTSVVDVATISGVGKFSQQLAPDYYRSEAFRQVLLFAVVVSLMDRALQDRALRQHLRIYLLSGAAVALGVSLWIHSNVQFYSLRMTLVGRDLSFGSAVLNLLLWSILISSKRRDRELLLITGGLGLQFTGEALGQSLRQIAGQHRNLVILWFGNLFLVTAHIVRLYVWWEAFRSRRSEVRLKDGGPQADAPNVLPTPPSRPTGFTPAASHIS
jgi:hypothetical protein